MLNRQPRQTAAQKKIHRQWPDYDCSKQPWMASTWQTIPNQRQQWHYCATDDYDNCPIYLCCALRSSRSLGLDRENLLASGK